MGEMSDDDLPPELEDMTEQLSKTNLNFIEKQKQKQNEVLDDDTYYDINGNKIKKSKNNQDTNKTNKNDDKKIIKKGFFDKPKSKPKEKTTNDNKPKEEIIDVKHNPNNNSLVFDDVQQSMQSIKNMDPKQ